MIMYCCARDCWRMRWDFVVEQRRVFSRTQGVYTINFFPFFFFRDTSLVDLFFLFFLKRPKIQKLYIQVRRGSMKYTIREKGEDFASLTKAKGRVANKNLQVGQFLRD